MKVRRRSAQYFQDKGKLVELRGYTMSMGNTLRADTESFSFSHVVALCILKQLNTIIKDEHLDPSLTKI